MFLLACFFNTGLAGQEEKEAFLSNLLEKMTLEEKVGQMTQISISEIIDTVSLQGWEKSGKLSIDVEKLKPFIKDYHVGSFLNGYAVGSKAWYHFINELQTLNAEFSRLDIPIIFGIDHIHGATYLENATIFPQAISLACSFNPQLAREIGEVTVHESGHLGHRLVFNPVMDLARNKFWPRMHETFGEDPFLASRMGEAYIQGIQQTSVHGGGRVAACAKHFLGYSAPVTGRDRSPAEISDQTLHEIHRPPFQAAIDAGVNTVMLNSGEINGVPVHASHDIVTGLLREKMGFEGVVITDWADIISLHEAHRVAETEKEAVRLAINAGVDMSMVPYSTSFCEHLVELVRENKISEERIDSSVMRILSLKYEIELFETPFPVDKDITGNPGYQEKAREAILESIVLMRNEGNLLPLDDTISIVLAGSTANMKRSLTGGWTYLWGHQDDTAFPDKMLTIKEALFNRFGEDRVIYANADNIREKSHRSGVIVIASGEPSAQSEGFNNTTNLDLPQSDIVLIKEALLTGKPVVLVLTEGRPRTFPRVAPALDAIVYAGLPGYYGAEAIAGLLAGDFNPSGKLSFTYPYHQSFQLNYDHKPTAFTFLHENTTEIERYAIGEFGEGLSYTTFKYDNLVLSSDTLRDREDNITALVRVTNTGDLKGKESVLWFIRDEYGKITRPGRALKHFEKYEIMPGESRLFEFEIEPVRDLSYPDEEGEMMLEPGKFTLMVGDQELGFFYIDS